MKELKISLKNITKVYATEEVETHALQGLNLDIYAGDFVSICGPSGCGKSTLLSILGLLDLPSSGTFMLENKDVSKLSLTEAAIIRNEKIGFVFQSFNLIDELSVFENIALPLRYNRISLSEKEIAVRVENCLARVDMSHRIHHKPNQLSGGQQQRIAIARALVGNPAVLLVDEATGNLDAKNGDAVMTMLKELNDEGTTICMVTHDPRYANHATTHLHLIEGKIVADGGQLSEVI